MPKFETLPYLGCHHFENKRMCCGILKSQYDNKTKQDNHLFPQSQRAVNIWLRKKSIDQLWENTLFLRKLRTKLTAASSVIGSCVRQEKRIMFKFNRFT